MLKMYPRGYVGPILNNTGDTTVAPASITNEIKVVQNTYKLDTKIKQVEIVPDSGVEKLFLLLRKDSNIIFDFSYREQVLYKAKELFSLGFMSKSFKTFLEVQLNSSKVTYNHIEVLKEITDFIFHGKVGFKMVTWERILSSPDNITYLSDKSKRDLAKEFNKYPSEIDNINLTIQKWVSNPDGYSHLVRSMWLLFGNLLPDHEE